MKKEEQISELIQMAWCDKTSFEDIQAILGKKESEVIRLMQKSLKPSSFRLWRKRVCGRALKHKKRARVQIK